jgi:hypothetical protein
MQQSKAIELLTHFKKEDLKEFGAFLASPFFNRNKKVLALYKMLISRHPAFESPTLSNERLFKRLYPKSAYNGQMMRELNSSLFKLAKEYLSIRQLRNNPAEMINKRADWLFENGLAGICQQDLAQNYEILSRSKVRDYEYYYRRWVADYFEFHFLTGTQRGLEDKMVKTKVLGAHLHSLSKFYLLRLLESYLYMMNTSRIFNQPLDPAFSPQIEALGAEYAGKGDLLIDIYYKLFLLVRDADEQYFFQLKAIVLAGNSSIEKAVTDEIIVNLENYCIYKLRTGDKRFEPELWQLYRFIADHELMLMEGEVPYSFYKNAITIGSDLAEGQWVQAFAEKYRRNLPARFADEVYHYCQAYICCAARQYEEALKFIAISNPYNNFTKIDIKTLTARIHYELGMYDQLDILLDSIPHHIHRETISAEKKEVYMSFVSFTKQLVQLKQHFSLKAWNQLRTDISQQPAIANRRWLLEKVAETGKAHHVSQD